MPQEALELAGEKRQLRGALDDAQKQIAVLRGQLEAARALAPQVCTRTLFSCNAFGCTLGWPFRQARFGGRTDAAAALSMHGLCLPQLHLLSARSHASSSYLPSAAGGSEAGGGRHAGAAGGHPQPQRSVGARLDERAAGGEGC